MRGNRRGLSLRVMNDGSIPAHAGEPPLFLLNTIHIWVYPRACGGTASGAREAATIRGLSPRMRGNRVLLVVRVLDDGSIPAHAGEPSGGMAAVGSTGVYPRACGGTLPSHPSTLLHTGLSPRMRGNQDQNLETRPYPGSIPAHAGEPRSPRRRRRFPRVYPRAGGGTSRVTSGAGHASGLSPRMRGNRVGQGAARVVLGSIPAHAGEPYDNSDCYPAKWVYPRACGGTPATDRSVTLETGLSPRMRGNRQSPMVARTLQGSIPAHAGEP